MAFIGQVIDDKYEVLTQIGEGGMSRVYLARDKRLNKQWAIKEIEKNAHDSNSRIVVQSAIDEANLIKQLDCPSIVRIVDIIDSGNVIYIVEDYIEGETLKSIVEHEGAQPQKRVADWGKQICQALDYLHSRNPRIIYRDMKPGNVMLKPDGNIMIIDFGIAREYDNRKVSDTVNLGTRGYAAPEQFGGKGQTDPRTDIYCLGATLYHLVTGHDPSEPPYEIKPIRHWNPNLSVGLEEVIQRCTMYDPEERYQTALDLFYALDHYDEVSKKYIAEQRKKLRIFLAAVAAMLVFVLVGVLGLGMSAVTNNNDYDENVARAEKASSSAERADYYIKAIGIKPREISTYLDLVNAFKEDAAFTNAEDALLKQNVNVRLAELRDEPGYARLAYEIGKLYWYYYEYGKTATSDNSVTRMKSSVEWFEDALKYGSEGDDFLKIAKVYSEIGKFSRDITLNIEEASDKGKYAPYWRNIGSLIDTVAHDEDENEIVSLEIYRLAMNSIENYARKFKADGVTQAEMETMYDTLIRQVSSMSTYSDKSEQIKKDILSRADAVSAAIENAFRR